MRRLIPIIMIGMLSIFLAACRSDGAQAQLITSDVEQVGFARATGPREWTFPADYGPHPDYQTEWWYYVGNLETAEGRRFGYQLTFFRRALQPEEQRTERTSDWATEQIYFAHFAVSDIGANEFNSFDLFSRGAAGLSGAQAEPYRVFIEDWVVEEIEDETYVMQAAQGGVGLDLQMTLTKPPILQGIDGYSQKSADDPGNASYYYSMTRLDTTGTVTIQGDTFEVSGTSWKDHEFSTSALGEGQIGWDWFALQLDDNTDYMLYQMRRDDGSVDALSKGAAVAPDGTSQTIYHAEGDYTIEVLDTWRSPNTGAVYPAQWRIEIPAANLTMTVTPLMADQEHDLNYAYWEGAVSIEGERDGEPISGWGYVEMTGYVSSMQNEF